MRKLHVLSRPEQDPWRRCGRWPMRWARPSGHPGSRPAPGGRQRRADPEKLAQTVAALMPEHAIVSDESVSYGRGFYRHSHAAPAHDWLHLAGGAIGDGLPVATGAAIGAGGSGA
jgi:acetolactate synthase-1/2/3 large subunit